MSLDLPFFTSSTLEDVVSILHYINISIQIYYQQVKLVILTHHLYQASKWPLVANVCIYFTEYINDGFSVFLTTSKSNNNNSLI